METTEKIKRIISGILSLRGIKVDKIILFGSRAGGKNSKSSDYDILVIVEETISPAVKMELCSEIRQKSAAEKIDVDVLIKSTQEAEIYRTYIGTVVREALKEGVAL